MFSSISKAPGSICWSFLFVSDRSHTPSHTVAVLNNRFHFSQYKLLEISIPDSYNASTKQSLKSMRINSNIPNPNITSQLQNHLV